MPISEARKIERRLDKLTTQTDGVCDLCGLPIDQHPCGEHRAAMLGKQIEDNLKTQAEAWGGVPHQAIIPGVL